MTFDTSSDATIFWVHLDATEYNSIVGPAFEFEDLPGILFLVAIDSQGSFLPCITNHWVTSCGFEGPILVDSVLTFSIWIKNPAETGSWGVFVTDDSLNYIYQTAYTSSDLVFKNVISKDIDLYFAYADFSNNEDHYMHDLELLAYIDAVAVAGSMFTVAFPSRYDFSEYPGDTIKCSILYFTVDDAGADTVETVLEDADCDVMDDSVVFTLNIDQTFTSDNWTYFAIYDVLTPELMYEGREEEFEFNLDGNVYYSENFCVLYSTEADGIVSASFDNLNAAFVGFTTSDLEPLVVNDDNNLLVTPGTWSGPYTIANGSGKFSAESVLVTWTPEEDFISLDEEVYTLDFIDNVAYFWVGVPSTNNGEYIDEGRYVISWEIEETAFTGLENYYARPRNTIVEISYELVFSVVLSPPDIYVPLTGWGMPINLQFQHGDGRDISSFPYESIEITFVEDADLELYFRPNPLVLTRDVSAGFVSIQCTACNGTSGLTFAVSVEGTDASAFAMEQDTYNFISGSRYSTPATFSIDITDILASEFTLSVTSDQIGVATWTLVNEQAYLDNENITDYDYILNNSYILGAEQNSKDDLDSLKDKHSAQLKELDDMYDNYEELTKKKLSLSRNILYTAQSMVLLEGTTELSQLTGLAPKTTYFVYLYFDNFDGSDAVGANETVVTARTPSHATLAFTFTTTVPSQDELESNLKKIFGLPTANYNLDSFTGGRRLADSNTVVVYSDTSSSTSAYSTALDSQSDIESSSDSSVEISAIIDSETTVEFDADSVWTTDRGIVLTLNYSTSVDGSIVCTIEGNGTTLTSDMVYEGVNANGDSVDQLSDTISAGINYLALNFTDEGYTTLGTYHVSCIVCNDFPGTPDCSDAVEETDYKYTAVEDNTSSSSGAEALVVAFAAYFLF